ncbi:hypothetical protein MMC13_000999 [Lambiella insularis]|nr:hypothetical protein [Lambiella insularis]
MSFRKRNIGVSGPADRAPPVSAERVDSSANPSRSIPSNAAAHSGPPPGVRPSPLDGRPTTSTGTLSLDGLLAGHAGLALGCSVLLEESGTTDYAGTLLRYYAAEGVVQGHSVHVVGMGEQWGRELPGLVPSVEGRDGGSTRGKEDKERMKIAWRYEGLGEFGVGGSSSRGGSSVFCKLCVHSRIKPLHCRTIDCLGGLTSPAPPIVDRSPAVPVTSSRDQEAPVAFCHSFDLTKRLALPSSTAIDFIPIRQTAAPESPLSPVTQALLQILSSSKPETIHRLVIPSLLSPAFYPPHASAPEHILQFLHALRALLRRYPTRLTTMLSLPLTLYPRSTGLVRMMEILSDGVIELVPFPHTIDTGPSLTTSGAATAQEEKPQGMVKIHRLPIFHERGGGVAGSAGVGDDLAFTVSRRKFVIKPFSLPPVEGDTEAQRGEVEGGKATKVDMDF